MDATTIAALCTGIAGIIAAVGAAIGTYRHANNPDIHTAPISTLSKGIYDPSKEIGKSGQFPGIPPTN